MHGPGGAPNKGWLTDFRETIGSRENSHETSMVDGGDGHGFHFPKMILP